MSEDQNRRPVDAETPSDYSYDMAHDAGPEVEHPVRPGDESRDVVHEPPAVPEDPDRDYSYDLAHEVPPAQRGEGFGPE